MLGILYRASSVLGFNVSAADSARPVKRIIRAESCEACEGTASVSPLFAAVTSLCKGDTYDRIVSLSSGTLGVTLLGVAG